MGAFEVNVTVANPAAPERSATVQLLVDTGATLPWIPRSVLESLGVQSVARRTVLLADGRRVTRDTGIVMLSFDGVPVGVTVVFAELGDGSVLGVTALEQLGVAVDPVEKKLLPRDLLAL
ncbi:MAG: clan AA aspartic protease [Terriglobia bacterium]